MEKSKLTIPSALSESIKTGKVLLFVGAGSSVGIKNADGGSPPNGSQLSNLLSQKFLAGTYDNQNLQFVSSLAISETNLVEVQEYIRKLYEGLVPNREHILIPTFKWRAIFTTNYDTVLEEAYKLSGKAAVQKISPIRSNEDSFDHILRAPENVPLVKLHGCITKTNDSKSPLILTSDQYLTHRDGRDHLFNFFDDLAREYPIIFVGYGLQDSDIRIALLKLERLNDSRPRSYIVSPHLREEEKRFWETKKITALEGTFEEFIDALDTSIPLQTRKVLASFPASTQDPIEKRFVVHEKLSESGKDFIENSVLYLHPNIKTENHPLQKFYKGFDLGWFGIEKKLDIKRDLLERLLYEVVILDDTDRPTKVDFYVIKAPAGSGKTILLRRVAWEAAMDAKQLCLYVKEDGILNYSAVAEIHQLTKERIFLFIDNISERVGEIEKIITQAKKEKIPLTIIGAERFNEWNIHCESLDKYVSRKFELEYLNDREIIDLIAILEKYNLLGHLQGLSQEERVKSFQKKSGRQLLVALHETTLGKRFEDIIVDEFNEIRPRLAQLIYLSVCSLNRFKVSVRAGLIARVYGIPFTEFKEKFFLPLDNVVQVVDDYAFRDYLYKSRHPQIAEIVFQRILSFPQDKFNEYIKLIEALNVSYSTDFFAFKKLLQARALLELFPDHDLVVQIYKLADKLEPNDAYIYQQRGIYEMHRPNGGLNTAHEYLTKARELSDRDGVIRHSLAELALKRAEVSISRLEKEKYLNEAESISEELLSDSSSKKYARHTLIKIALDRLSTGLDEKITNPEIDDLVREIERHLEKAHQENPSDSHVLLAESRFKDLLQNKGEAFDALRKAFDVNKRDSFVAVRLSKAYEAQGKIPDAVDVVREALEENPGEKSLHFRLATLLQKTNPTDIDSLIYHFKRGFTPMDQNFDAQFWYGYYSFMKGETLDIIESKKIFRVLRDAPISHDLRMKVRASLLKEGKPEVFSGKLVAKEVSYGFVERDGISDQIFVHGNNLAKDKWDALKVDDVIKFNIDFNFSGPIATNISTT